MYNVDLNNGQTPSSAYFFIYFLFKLIYLRSIAKQVIPTYINHSRPLIPDGIHLFFERGLRGERRQTCPYMLSAKQGSIWYHFYNVFGMTRSGIEPTTSRSRGERSNHWATAAYFMQCVCCLFVYSGSLALNNRIVMKYWIILNARSLIHSF